MTRQRIYQLKLRLRGLCERCGKPRGNSGSVARCDDCLSEHRVLQRRRLGHGEWTLGQRGRPPLWFTTLFLLLLAVPAYGQSIQQTFYIRWTVPAGPVDGYVMSRTVNGAFSGTFTFKSAMTNYVTDTVSGPPLAQVCYTVQAYNVAGSGALATQQCMTLPPAPSPLPPVPTAPTLTVNTVPGA